MSSDKGEQTISSSDDREKPPSREIAPPAGRDDEDDAGVLEPEDLIVLEGEDLPEDLKQEILEQLRSEEDLDEAEVRALEALLMKEEADGRDIFTMDEDAPASEGELFVIVEQMPELLGGGLSAVERQVRYPAEARAAGISGRVFVQFVVDEQGDVVDPHVVQGIGAGCDEEALRVVRGLKFNPGRQRGQPVKVQMLLPITFQAPR